MFRAIVKWCIHIFSLIVFRVKTVGQKENVPKTGGYMMCANHTSNWDAPILVSSTKRMLYVMAKQELFKNNFIKWFAKKMRCISC